MTREKQGGQIFEVIAAVASAIAAIASVLAIYQAQSIYSNSVKAGAPALVIRSNTPHYSVTDGGRSWYLETKIENIGNRQLKNFTWNIIRFSPDDYSGAVTVDPGAIVNDIAPTEEFTIRSIREDAFGPGDRPRYLLMIFEYEDPIDLDTPIRNTYVFRQHWVEAAGEIKFTHVMKAEMKKIPKNVLSALVDGLRAADVNGPK